MEKWGKQLRWLIVRLGVILFGFVGRKLEESLDEVHVNTNYLDNCQNGLLVGTVVGYLTIVSPRKSVHVETIRSTCNCFIIEQPDSI